MRYINTLIIILLLLYSLLPVKAIEYGGIGGRPAYPREEVPRSDSIFIHEIREGQVINEGIKVINNTNEEKTLIIFSADYQASTDGGFACEQYEEEKNGVGRWINLEQSEITLNALSSSIVDFKITIPSSIDVGEHNGCIVIQEKKVESTESGLNLAIRTGLRVLLTLPGDIIRELELTDFKVVDHSKTRYILSPTITNKGNVSVNADVIVDIKDILGQDIKRFQGEYGVLKDNPLTLNFDLEKPFWGGIYKAQTIVNYNNGEEDITLTSEEIIFVCIPNDYVIIGFVTLAISMFLFIIIKRRKKRKEKRKGKK